MVQAAVNVQIGCGDKPLDGFVNIDIRPACGDVPGHAYALPYESGSVSTVFSNAVLEHLYMAHQVFAVREWARVTRRIGGRIITLGIPDFAAIARLYLDGAQGICGDRFDVFEVMRYTHGDPEGQTTCAWAGWSPLEHLDDCPPGWLPQLHKSLFDGGSLANLFKLAGLRTVLFRYVYPGDPHAVSLGVIAGHTHPALADLARIPGFGDYVDADTLEPIVP
jgi:hypothetical protein